ncbi:histone-like transcription factor and archaeal histone [Colletotrichum karsti]|uniref:NCT transcriptional regulatory complex subunit A n=1 Tax=Colletotrichum karsti TaxID=1095194 RepID=A0A9P6I7P9_9PEZI|nr:histone-like transcription factor and archaeal histone [Colletotrichum karsti]KAF9875511.1 histone-like transcription factor and archaeal histone [Colletotrichum karsti]
MQHNQNQHHHPQQYQHQHQHQHQQHLDLDLSKLQTPGPAPLVYEYSSPPSRAYQPHQPSSTPAAVHNIKQEQPHYPPSEAFKSEYSSYQPPLQTGIGTHPHHQHHHQPHQQYLSPRYHHQPPPPPQQQQQQQQQQPPPTSPGPYGQQPLKYHDQHSLQYQPPTPQSQPFLEKKQQTATPNLYDIPYNPDSQQLPQTPGSATMPPRKNTQSAPSPPPIDPSPVRTKFPTARIKRIMQADEEVGKVAQQTPIAVGKALELFMIAVVSKSAEIAREKNSKRVTAQMLKQVIETDGQYDFLADIAAKVGEEEKRGGRSKADTESDEEMEVEPKKKGKGGRKKKVA